MQVILCTLRSGGALMQVLVYKGWVVMHPSHKLHGECVV